MKTMLFNGNNRKRTRGRQVKTIEFTGPKTDKEGNVLKTTVDRGFIPHRAKKHLASVCPQTGTELWVKEGKGDELPFVTTLPKGTPIPMKKYGMKVWIEEEATNGKVGGFGW